MDHVSKAVQYFEKGFMCSQAVFASFAEQFGITEKQALQIGACFGGGMRKAEVCGACTGALMVEFLDKFKNRKGSYICREILGCDISTDEGRNYARSNGLYSKYCPEMVRTAAEILTEILGGDEE